MKRLVLFSSPKGKNLGEIIKKIFPSEIENKVFAYLPTHKKYLNEEFADKWKDTARKYDAEFLYIDLEEPEDAKDKITKANILLMTGGNTFWLLDFLRKTGLYDAIKELYKKPEFIIAGWSAGAMVMTPTIAIGGLPNRDGGSSPMDDNKVGLTDLTAFNFVDFEIFPHYDESLHKKTFDDYNKMKNGKVKALTDDEYIIINLYLSTTGSIATMTSECISDVLFSKNFW